LQQTNLAQAPRGRPGRPPRHQAEQRRGELLDHALQVFLDRGYEGATVDLIAAAASASKRTIYAHYEDKAALFRAAVLRAIEEYARQAEKLSFIESDDLEETLTALARMRLVHLASPVGIRLQRILNAESFRFPEIFTWAYEQGSRPMVDLIAQVLQRHIEAGRVELEDPRRAANLFLSTVVGGPARILWSGNVLEPEELEERVRFSVRLFLRGALKRADDA
jgi:AcrR family transcriptional regulator